MKQTVGLAELSVITSVDDEVLEVAFKVRSEANNQIYEQFSPIRYKSIMRGWTSRTKYRKPTGFSIKLKPSQGYQN